ncbi:MAG: LytTR family DNA-binding domain-containing protein [Lachnospiraceae bacterium]|nr:LytTR family DNA-binding domain-containing protein [Lachnospiraceae bacterium]
MLRLAIVDDDERYRNEIKGMLLEYEKEYGESFQITEYSDGDELVENYKSDFDIILLDVEMRFMDGMSAAEEIRKVDSDVILVFITNMPQYAIKGYRVDALDYILKPLSYFPFSQTIKRAIGRRHVSDKNYIIISVKGGKQKVDAEEIRFIEVINHDLIIHTINEDIETKGSIREMDEKLKGESFFQCNKGYLINLAFVDGLTGNDVRIGDDILQVSRSKKKPLIDALNDYMREMGR